MPMPNVPPLPPTQTIQFQTLEKNSEPIKLKKGDVNILSDEESEEEDKSGKLVFKSFSMAPPPQSQQQQMNQENMKSMEVQSQLSPQFDSDGVVDQIDIDYDLQGEPEYDVGEEQVKREEVERVELDEKRSSSFRKKKER